MEFVPPSSHSKSERVEQQVLKSGSLLEKVKTHFKPGIGYNLRVFFGLQRLFVVSWEYIFKVNKNMEVEDVYEISTIRGLHTMNMCKFYSFLVAIDTSPNIYVINLYDGKTKRFPITTEFTHLVDTSIHHLIGWDLLIIGRVPNTTTEIAYIVNYNAVDEPTQRGPYTLFSSGPRYDYEKFFRVESFHRPSTLWDDTLTILSNGKVFDMDETVFSMEYFKGPVDYIWGIGKTLYLTESKENWTILHTISWGTDECKRITMNWRIEEIIDENSMVIKIPVDNIVETCLADTKSVYEGKHYKFSVLPTVHPRIADEVTKYIRFGGGLVGIDEYLRFTMWNITLDQNVMVKAFPEDASETLIVPDFMLKISLEGKTKRSPERTALKKKLSPEHKKAKTVPVYLNTSDEESEEDKQKKKSKERIKPLQLNDTSSSEDEKGKKGIVQRGHVKVPVGQSLLPSDEESNDEVSELTSEDEEEGPPVLDISPLSIKENESESESESGSDSS